MLTHPLPPYTKGRRSAGKASAVSATNDYQQVPFTSDPWRASQNRYESMIYRRVGNSGLILPAISLGLWYNFGDNRAFDIQRDILRHAFDKGVIHFDLANNYGPPYGAAEENLGRMLRSDFRPYRR